LASHFEDRTQIGGVVEYGAEENIWTNKGRSNIMDRNLLILLKLSKSRKDEIDGVC
jgi:hypothetical protein